MKVWDKKIHAFIDVKKKVAKDGTSPKINKKKNMSDADGAIKTEPSAEVDGGVS